MPRTLDDAALELIAERLRVLADPTRLRLVNALRHGERTVSDLLDCCGTSQANVSQHMSLLHRHGVVARRKEGLHVYYAIADPRVFELCELVCESLERQLEERRAALG